ncbi:hypothetical protein FBU30_000095 [Linnemannia zychae]|nr:hypothetical protein FBU30_000095 [Linnemannia zychae]
MGFSIVVTICTLAGLLFCFRRASALMPRNLTIPLQMFGQSSDLTRGPIALSDDDMEGATRIDWEELDAQFVDLDGDDESSVTNGDAEDDAGARLLNPVKKQTQYLDNDDVDDDLNVGEPYRTEADETMDSPFVDDDDADKGLVVATASGGNAAK